LVVVFFVLGGLLYALNFALPAFVKVTLSGNAAQAQSQTASAYQLLRLQAQAFDRQVAACHSLGSTAALAQCFETNDARFASELQGYASTVSSINYPSDVSTEVSALESATARASATLTRLSQTGPDLTAYVAAVGGSNIVAQLYTVTTTTNELESALGTQVTEAAIPSPSPS
jgi:hypothetical protein